MTTVLQYLVIAAVVAAVLFGIALFVFGRGEQLAPLPARTSPADLPERDISGDDVRGVRFAMAARGYRMSDVDWTLERLADELDRTKARLAEIDPDNDFEADPFETGPDQRDLFAGDDPVDPADQEPSPDRLEPDVTRDDPARAAPPAADQPPAYPVATGQITDDEPDADSSAIGERADDQQGASRPGSDER